MNDLPLIIIGAGVHSRVLIDTLHLKQREILFLTDVATDKYGQTILGVCIQGADELVHNFSPDDVRLVNGVGSIDRPTLHRKIFETWQDRGYTFSDVIHPSVILSSHIRLGQGTQILAGAIVQAGTTLCDNTIINTGAQVDHDCFVGDHTQIAPGATLCGQVRVESMCHIGAGATIIQGIKIGAQSVVGAGAVVIRDVPPHSKVVGVPAQSMKK